MYLKSNGVQVDRHLLFKNENLIKNFGTRFIVGPYLKEKVVQFYEISDKICGIKIRGGNKNLFILNIQAR